MTEGQERLKCSAVTVNFGGIVALEDIDVTVPSATVVGLVGPNGAGKSTLFGVLSGLLRPSKGTVVLDGVDITDSRPQQRANWGMARTFQHPELFADLTVREHLVLAHRAKHDQRRIWSDLFTMGSFRSADTVEKTQVDELVAMLGLTAIADRTAVGLPLGVARLIELGRALASSPTVLLLDEPSVWARLLGHRAIRIDVGRYRTPTWDFGVAGGARRRARHAHVLVGIRAGLRQDDRETDHRTWSEPIPGCELRIWAKRCLARTQPPTAVRPPGDQRMRSPVFPCPRRLRMANSSHPRWRSKAFPCGTATPRRCRMSRSTYRRVTFSPCSVRMAPERAASLAPSPGWSPPEGRSSWPAKKSRGGQHTVCDALGIVHLPEGRGVFRGLTVTENLRMAVATLGSRQARREGVERAFEIFPALDRRRHHIAGLLSGGEQQMLSLARALATMPKLLIADELSLGLAPLMVDVVFEGLARARDAGVTVIMTEQYVYRALSFADQCLVLQRGEIAWRGPADIAKGEVLRHYLGDGMMAAT